MRVFRNQYGWEQRLAQADLVNGGVDTFASLIRGRVAVVYSDPPWNPGNEKYWRRFAGENPPEDYRKFLDAWCACASACDAEHVFCEQSIIRQHRKMFFDAVDRAPSWKLPAYWMWTVQYGSPKRPNVLIHFGHKKIDTDPSWLSGEKMTRMVFMGLHLKDGDTVADPCMGLGMTSRVAHKFGLNCIGTELNPKRLDRTIDWLLKHGYQEQ